MIGYLTGTAAGPRLVLVGGVGFVVHTPTPLTAGEQVALHVHTVVSEQAITLYGFGTETELAMFTALTAVTGVGAKMALALLRDVGVRGIAAAVTGKNPAALTKAAGVGPKVAGRVVAETRLPAGIDVGAPDPDAGPAEPATGIEAELTGALEGLGYSRDLAVRAARAAVTAAGDPDDVDAGTLLSAALGHLRGAA